MKDIRQFPAKLYVETTTRCNLRCSMCVKQAQGAVIPEADMTMDTFRNLAPAFPNLGGLILNGIGEPLLTPHLSEMIRFARKRMPEDGSIKFQTNGMLLTPEIARELVEAGLDTICLSIDVVDRDGAFHGGEDVSGIEHAFTFLRRAAETAGRPLSIGVEFVLMRDTAEALPRSIAWAADQGAEFVLVTHMFPYGATGSDQDLFNPNTDQSMAEFDRWRAEADERGLDLNRYFGSPWKFRKTPDQAALAAFVTARKKDALSRGIPIHVTSLLEWSTPEKLAEQAWLAGILAEAQAVADERGLDASLPPVCATHDRTCDFVEQGVAHITADGDVRPCYFLWHEYSCHMDGGLKKVTPRTFGNVNDSSVIDIWQSEAYRHFRREVLDYSYPYCSNCSVVPCSDVTGTGYGFVHDCVGVDVPCGHCLWCNGGIRCLT